MSSVIPLGASLKSGYIVSEMVEKNDTGYRFTDYLGRTQGDRDFIEKFESFFYSAGSGNLERCQRVA
jgi:hypothetical protein